MPFTHSSKAKRPKFLLNLQIKELVNIPQSSGFCYTKWRLKDGTGTSGHKTALDGEHQSASTQSRGTTQHVHVQHHRAQWNYSLDKPVLVKLHLDKNGKFLKKPLVLEVFFEFADGSSTSNLNSSPNVKVKKTTNSNATALMAIGNNSYSQKVTGKLLLGTVDIDVAEYVKEDETPTTNRFLLKHSKVNSIINVSLQLKLIRGSYEDFKVSKSVTNDQLANFRPGINTILDNSSELSTPTSTTNQTSTNNTSPNTNGSGNGTSVPKPTNNGARNGTSIKSPTSINTKSNGATTRTGLSTTISSSMTPLIESLYQKTFKLPWDPRPGEFTPRECVEDILQGGNGWAKNEKGINLIDLQALKLNELEEDYYNPNYGKSAASKASNWPPNPNDDGYSSMDKREYLEKKQNWSHMSRAQRAKLRTHNDDDHENSDNDKSANDSSDVIEDNNPTDFLTDRIRENKSWSITSPSG